MSKFVATIEEIQEAIPNSRWRKVDKLMSAIADEELMLLQPILGEELMNWLEEQSVSLRDKLTSLVDVDEKDLLTSESKTIELLSQVRKAAIYRMLSNNTEILSVSFNEGGGHNRTETDQYDSMSMSDLETLSRKYYHKSVARIETVLLLLEKDAQDAEPVFAEKWRKSDYFYLHGDLLFPHLRSIKHYYKNIGDERIKFANLCPDIRFCQNTYITPLIGEDIVKMLCCIDTSANDTAAYMAVRRKALVLVRTTLGLHISARTAQKDERQGLIEAANMASAQMVRYIKENQSSFGDAIETSPLYTPPVTDEPSETARPKCRPHYNHFCSLVRGVRKY